MNGINGACYRNPVGDYGVVLTENTQLSVGDSVRHLPDTKQWIRANIDEEGKQGELATARKARYGSSAKRLRKNPKIGMNLFTFNYFSSEYIFSDVFKQTSEWFSI